MTKFDDLSAEIAEHERAIAELRQARRSFVPELVAGAYVADETGNWPMLKDVARALGLPAKAVRQAIADQTPAPGDEALLEAILRLRGGGIPKTYTSISKELRISPLRVRDILARHWQREYAGNQAPAPATPPDSATGLAIDMITREALRLFRNSNWFLTTVGVFDEEFREGHVWHIREWHQQPGARIGAQLRIRLPNEYSLDDYSARVLRELG